MAITYKLFLDERTQSGDKFPLKLRVTYNRKHRVVSLNVLLRKEEWNAKLQKVKASHPNAKLITIKVNQALNDIQENALKFEKVEKVYSVEQLVGIDKGFSSKLVTFKSFATDEINSLRAAGRIGNAEAYKTACDRLLGFVGSEHLKFEQIDFKLLDGFANSMLAENVTVNAIASYMRQIRALYNKAINADLVEAKYYPFKKYKIKTTKTVSRALTISEMNAIACMEIEPDTPMWHAQNYFMLSFCLIGINFTDLFKLTRGSIKNGRVIFNRSKTKKIYSINMPDKAKEIINRYLDPVTNGDYILPVLCKGDSPEKIDSKCHQAIKNANKYLGKIAKICRIDANVTTYYARYTWANIAKSLGYSKDLIAEALGHEYGNAVTGIYLDAYDTGAIDVANAAVIKAVYRCGT
jgi:integrase